MDSESRYLQHFKRIEDLLEPIIDLEPHPIKLETEAETLARATEVIAHTINDTYKHNINTISWVIPGYVSNAINTMPYIYNGTIIIATGNISTHRQDYIHRCLYCGTQDESIGVDIYNIVCDACAMTAHMERTFLSNEDYKYETLILDEGD